MFRVEDTAVSKLLENRGWVVECTSPLEISHTEMETWANRYCAQVVIDDIVWETISAVMDKKVEEWHQAYSEEAKELHHHLDMSATEYFDWVRNPKSLTKEKVAALIEEYNHSPEGYSDFLD